MMISNDPATHPRNAITIIRDTIPNTIPTIMQSRMGHFGETIQKTNVAAMKPVRMAAR
jgi:hypothetical protein